MRYSSLIDNITAKEWGLSIQQAYLFEWIYTLPSWASKAIVNGEEYFFASRNKAIDDLPLLTDKTDTMYRYYKQLEEKGIIKLVKVDGRDYILLTEKAKKWGRASEYSEKNPSGVGKKSENNSEKNPTYNIINNTDNIINIPSGEENSSPSLFPKDINEKSTLALRDEKVKSIAFNECKNFWLNVFHKGWTFDASAGKNLKNIISKIKFKHSSDGLNCRDDDIIESFKALCINLPKFFEDKDLAMINSKFNEIFEQIKKSDNGNSRNSEKSESKYRN